MAEDSSKNPPVYVQQRAYLLHFIPTGYHLLKVTGDNTKIYAGHSWGDSKQSYYDAFEAERINAENSPKGSVTCSQSTSHQFVYDVTQVTEATVEGADQEKRAREVATMMQNERDQGLDKKAHLPTRPLDSGPRKEESAVCTVRPAQLDPPT